MKVYPQVPQLPNFVTLRREDGGAIVATLVSVGELSDEDICDLGKRWTDALLVHAKRKRAAVIAGRGDVTASAELFG